MKSLSEYRKNYNEIKSKVKTVLKQIDGITGHGFSWNEDNEPRIRINVREVTEEIKEAIPESICGFKTEISESKINLQKTNIPT